MESQDFITIDQARELFVAHDCTLGQLPDWFSFDEKGPGWALLPTLSGYRRSPGPWSGAVLVATDP